MSSSDHDDRRDALADARRALLERRLRGEAVPPPEATIPPRPPADPVVLSAGQERLWFLHQLDPRSAAYHMYRAWRLRGPLDRAELEHAVRALVRRHEVLRTAIRTVDGHPAAEVVAAPPCALRLVDLRDVAAAEREERARAVAEEDVRRPFDLAAAPLLRGTLLVLADADHVFVLTVHHIAADEWSMDVLWRELAAHYAAPSGTAPPADLPLQYADYARWQRARRDSPDVTRQLAWWRRALDGEIPPLRLPCTRPRPARQSFRGALASRPLPAELSASLARLAREEGVTPFVLLLAAWQTLLHRYTNETDIVIGTPVSSRGRTELEGLIGFFLNTLVIRADLAGDPPFRTLVQQARARLLESLAHQDVPFERLVDELKPERRLGHNPLFQVMLVLQAPPPTGGLAPGIDAQPFELDAHAAKFDLTLFARATDERLELTLEYATDLFDRAAAERVLGHMEVLLAGIARDPDCRLSRLPLLAAAERRRLMEWSSTAPPVTPPVASVHELFAAQARRTPLAPALVFDGGSMTYGELDRRAGALARRLRALGVERGTCVGLCVERSPELIAGILGILRAGGAYVPLDPAYPSARLRLILDDTRAPVVLTRRHLAGQLPAAGVRLVLLDDERDDERDDGHAALADEAGSADDLAYVIHTSGSTGTPKGVPITHRQLVHSTLARLHYYGHAPDRFLLLSSFAFDSSAAGIFWTLCGGGTLVLPRPRCEQDVAALAALIRRERVTHTLCVPSLYAVVLEHAVPAALRSLAAVILAGEECAAGLARRHHALLPGTALYNEYGPTEATVWSTVYAVPPDLAGSVPIGRPIAGASVYVLDPHGEPVPAGVPGELYIGGAGVGRGYLDRPAETAARFIAVPALGEAVHYRTGDRVQWLPDGNLAFLGRLDEQVKVHGYRVEPREIAAVLQQHPSVRECVVVARGAGAEPPAMAEIAARLGALAADEAERMLRAVEEQEAVIP